MERSKQCKQLVLLYIHPSDYQTLRAAAVAARLSLHEFMLLGAWKFATEPSESKQMSAENPRGHSAEGFLKLTYH